MATWNEFETDAPDIAAAGRQLLYQFGVGLAFLATLRKDGAPRLHRFAPPSSTATSTRSSVQRPSAPTFAVTDATRCIPFRRLTLTTSSS